MSTACIPTFEECASATAPSLKDRQDGFRVPDRAGAPRLAKLAQQPDEARLVDDAAVGALALVRDDARHRPGRRLGQACAPKQALCVVMSGGATALPGTPADARRCERDRAEDVQNMHRLRALSYSAAVHQHCLPAVLKVSACLVACEACMHAVRLAGRRAGMHEAGAAGTVLRIELRAEGLRVDARQERAHAAGEDVAHHQRALEARPLARRQALQRRRCARAQSAPRPACMSTRGRARGAW